MSSTTLAVSTICQAVSARLRVPLQAAKYVLQQVDQGATVPFLARYRRDETGNLDEKLIRSVIDVAAEAREVERRRSFMMQSLEERRLLTPQLRDQLQKITELNQLEDVWEPFKIRKTSLASRGREEGLPGGELLHSSSRLPDLAHLVQKVKDAEKLLCAIIVEEVARNSIVRNAVLDYVEKTAVLAASGVKTARKNAAKALKSEQFEKLQKMFSFYDGKSWPVQSVRSHIVLAVQRGEEKGVLQVSMTCGPQAELIFRRVCKEQFPCILERQNKHQDSLEYRLLRKGLQSAFEYLIGASYKSVRRDLKQRAEEEAIDVFATNLRHLLLQRPMSHARILAMDPGLSNGVKCVALDESGNLIETFKCSVLEEDRMRRQVREVVQKLKLNKIVIGNGTASQRTAQVVSNVITESNLSGVEFAIVSEAGASVYSASEAANEEFPQLDILFRGAVSIGRRVLDPLSELVKIPVKSMGIGMYQHDVNEKKLSKALNETVESCVASVGINAAVANKYVMEKVPAITKQLVHQIVLARHAKKLVNRDDFRRVPGMTESTYTQIVGFFRFPNSTEPLDNTVLLPEWYDYVRRLAHLYKDSFDSQEKLKSYDAKSVEPSGAGEGCLNLKTKTGSQMKLPLQAIGKKLAREDESGLCRIASQIGCGLECLRLIQKELLHPGLDPRSSLPHAGFMRTKLGHVTELRKGDTLNGIVQSVTTFGAFVDCGLDQNILIKGLGLERTHPGALLENILFIGLDALGRPQVDYSTASPPPPTSSPPNLSRCSVDRKRPGYLQRPQAEALAPPTKSIKTEATIGGTTAPQDVQEDDIIEI